MRGRVELERRAMSRGGQQEGSGGDGYEERAFGQWWLAGRKNRKCHRGRTSLVWRGVRGSARGCWLSDQTSKSAESLSSSYVEAMERGLWLARAAKKPRESDSPT